MLGNLIQWKSLGDERGELISLEAQKNIPFAIQRVYYIFNTQSDVRRGFHAHKKLEQVLVCINGRCSILLDDGRQRITVQLDSPAIGLPVGAMIWHEMYDFSPGAVLIVLASAHYDEDDYIRDYEEFLEQVE
jgi:dTDP-4-dehydrorhamnose 3,5-epimerase-like enzyme